MLPATVRDIVCTVDLVYQVDTNEVPSDNTYRFFLKYLNLSGVRIKSFKIQLGTGTGANFALSSKGDGLSFATRDGATVENDDIGSYKDIDLSTFFAFGLFGDADTNTNHINDGYYDPINRGTFSMKVNSEDDIEATKLSDNVADLFTAWIPKSLAPMGYFFDFDDDPATEAALVADFDQDWQTYRLCTDLIMQKLIDSNLLTATECRSNPSDPPVTLSPATIANWANDIRLSTSTIDDLGNVNVNTHIKLENFAQTSFTIRLLPKIYLPGGSGGGDPHFQRWGQRRESFHGECDLVVLHSADFHQEGLAFHVRTTMASYYSYIESAAVRLGIDNVEVRNGSIVLNGNKFNDNELPITFGGNMYSYTLYLHKAVRSVHNEVVRRTYRLTLDDSSEIEFRFYKHYLTFTINGHPDFDGSRGILGAFPS